MLSSIRRKLLGETHVIPIGILATLATGLIARAVLPAGGWRTAGGFALVVMLIATLAVSLPNHPRRRPHAAEPASHTFTRTDT
jgi:hypothetical protein